MLPSDGRVETVTYIGWCCLHVVPLVHCSLPCPLLQVGMLKQLNITEAYYMPATIRQADQGRQD